MKKKCNVVMLPTKEKANLWITWKQILAYNSTLCNLESSQHLYIISDETPKANDWCVNNNADTVYQINGLEDTTGWNKVIATTDYHCRIGINTPKPSQQFIERYIEEYNKDNFITKVEVEYDFIVTNEDWSKTPVELSGYSQLKINSDNTINIKLPKTSWSKVEFMNALHNVELKHNKSYLNLWNEIEQNL